MPPEDPESEKEDRPDGTRNPIGPEEQPDGSQDPVEPDGQSPDRRTERDSDGTRSSRNLFPRHNSLDASDWVNIASVVVTVIDLVRDLL